MTAASDQKESWPARLTGNKQDKALGELRTVLKKGLTNFDMSIDDKDDVIQIALIKILDKLNSFQGKSSFTSWAIAIAVNTALSELRKRHWKNVSLEEAANMGYETVETSSGDNGPAAVMHRKWALKFLETIIDEDLTVKQRTALLAEINGMPLQEIATRMNVNRGAIYKLTFDARKKVIKSLAKKGLKPQDLMTSSG